MIFPRGEESPAPGKDVGVGKGGQDNVLSRRVKPSSIKSCKEETSGIPASSFFAVAPTPPPCDPTATILPQRDAAHATSP
mmetsp:Transcript_19375/g.56678  ORF Transcript_19375/g.56678 Transcript_19375/m.56678 type:complete len:80 (-) Transcript_19375:125-364(-)